MKNFSIVILSMLLKLNMRHMLNQNSCQNYFHSKTIQRTKGVDSFVKKNMHLIYIFLIGY